MQNAIYAAVETGYAKIYKSPNRIGILQARLRLASRERRCRK